MASSADAAMAPRRRQARRLRPQGWKRWLLLGACFGLGYGITHRLLVLRFETDWSGRQRFEVKAVPGTELDSLRRRFGDASMQIRGDLDLLELERQDKRDAAAIEQRRDQIEARARRQAQQDIQAEPPARQAPAADPTVDLPPPPAAPELPAEPAAAPEPPAPAAPTATP